MDAPFKKTPPKSAERIRATLESVQRDAAQVNTPGPYREGLQADEPLVIATFRDTQLSRSFQESLLQAGIMSSARVHRTSAEILVDHGDRQRAGELLDEFLVEHPDRPVESYRRDFDFAIFGMVLGATFGAIVLVAEFRGLREILVFLLFTLLGAITGSFLDRPRNRYRRTGQIQFGIGDLMVLMAMVALGIVLWRLLAGR